MRAVVVGTSEPNGYLRPGVALKPGEQLATGGGHAEANVVQYANQNGIRLQYVGATRPTCETCAPTIIKAGAAPATVLKNPAFPEGQ